jgi:hypothetical protein
MKKKTTTPTRCDIQAVPDAAEIARDFMELHLPAELHAICDLDAEAGIRLVC